MVHVRMLDIDTLLEIAAQEVYPVPDLR